MGNLNLWICFLGLLLAGPGAAQTIFTEVPIDIPLPPSWGVACGDYDNDQWPDIFLSGYSADASPNPAVLLGNQGKGRFANLNALIEPEFSPNNDRGAGVIFGDYDNDNDLDLYVPRGFIVSSARDRLLRNDRGRFTDVTTAAGLTDSLPSGNALWLDYDRDGWLDLYVGHILLNEDSPDLYNSLYRNQGDGTFTEVTEAAGLKMNLYPHATLRMGGSDGGMVAGDFNDDGWPDLYLGVSEASNRLFLNNGQGHFIDATTKEIGDEGQALGVAVGDIDNDGDLDIFQAAGGLEGLFRSLMLHNLGRGEFIDVTEGVGLTALGAQQTVGPGLADIDNDGDLDLLIATPTALFLNQGDGTFVDATSRSGLQPIALNLAFIDYDRDGFLDVMSGKSDEARPGGVFRNNGNGNHWLRVELVGTRSNRNGIGARLFATSGALRQRREIFGGMGNNQDEMVAHFGLGERTAVDRLEIRWPSGQLDVLTDIPADQQIRVIEGRTNYHAIELTRWQQVPPETLVAGTTSHLELAIQTALFDPEARITGVTADLSSLGGGAEVALAAEGDGTYHLRDFPLPITAPNGVHLFHVLIDQATSLGPYWSQLSRQVTVVPGGDLMVFDEALAQDWQVEVNPKIKRLDLSEAGVVQRGSLAGAFEGEAASSLWSVTFKPPAPLSPVGYTALRFAFHSGEVVSPSTARLTAALIPGRPVSLLDGARVDLNQKGWQIVEIPMGAFGREGPIKSIIFSGNLTGTFYLDDLRLVAVSPPLVTVVEEDHTTALPQSFSLSQNFPNPFNSETVIRFALPERGEVELAVFNLAGQQVVRLTEGTREAGSYTLRWDGRDAQGQELASGVYLYRLRAGERMETHKLALVR